MRSQQILDADCWAIRSPWPDLGAGHCQNVMIFLPCGVLSHAGEGGGDFGDETRHLILDLLMRFEPTLTHRMTSSKSTASTFFSVSCFDEELRTAGGVLSEQAQRTNS